MEKNRFGTTITSKSNHKEVQIVVTAFVDDGYFCTSWVESKHKIQEVVNYHAAKYEATGGKVQKEKVMMCGWK